jgi:hypothetical protein
VVRQTGEHPHLAAVVQAAGGLEVQRRADQLIDELEGLDVLNDAIIRSCG